MRSSRRISRRDLMKLTWQSGARDQPTLRALLFPRPNPSPCVGQSGQNSALTVMSVSASLQASARAAYRELLRASAVTFAGDAPVRNGTYGPQLSEVVQPLIHTSIQVEDAKRNNT